jgi:hypothetical protein
VLAEELARSGVELVFLKSPTGSNPGGLATAAAVQGMIAECEGDIERHIEQEQTIFYPHLSNMARLRFAGYDSCAGQAAVELDERRCTVRQI